mgnify:CR=1 FL=1
MKTILFSFFLLVVVLSSSCKKGKIPHVIDVNCEDTVSFQSDILPLITNSCISCHDVGNPTGYTFTNHTNISTHASSMLNAMRAEGGMQLMPQGGALPDVDIQKFSCWINQGKLNN